MSLQASLDLARTELARTVLKAPCDGVVMTRVIEPGTVVLPSSVVYSVAITNQVWIRAFVPEPMLGRVAPGTLVQVFTDTQPNHPYAGRIGYVSPAGRIHAKDGRDPRIADAACLSHPYSHHRP